MTKKITNDEYQSLALRYNEQRTINDSLQREIAELKVFHQARFKELCLEIDRLVSMLSAQQDELDKQNTTADEWNNRNRIS